MSAKLSLLLSHTCTKLGSKAWEFATPLLLLRFSPDGGLLAILDDDPEIHSRGLVMLFMGCLATLSVMQFIWLLEVLGRGLPGEHHGGGVGGEPARCPKFPTNIPSESPKIAADKRQDPAEVMARREVTSSYNHVYSCQLDEHKATSQKASGRCW